MNVNGILNKFSSEGMLNRNVLISEIILLAYGIFLLVFPTKALHLSVGFIGIVMLVAGLGCAVWFFLHRDSGNYPLLAIGVIGLVVGVLVLVFRSAVAMVLFPIMLGIWTFVSTLLAAFAAWGNYRMGTGLWWVPLLAAIVGAVVTVMIFMNLSGTERFMARILGIYFITYNIVRIGEFAVAYLAPATEVTERTSRKKSNGSSRRRVYEEDADEQEFDVYDYEEEYTSSRRSRRGRDEYDYDYEDDRY